jgi:nitrogen fixation protein FixH
MTTIDASSDNRISQSNKRAFRNPWVLGGLGLIGTVLAVNVTMITRAVTTNPGRYNESHYIQRVAERSALGWSASLDVPANIQRGATQTYRVIVVDKVGEPLRGAQVILNAYRPSDAKADFRLPLEEVGAGIYQTSVEFQLKGIWDLLIDVKQEGNSLELPRRIAVQG